LEKLGFRNMQEKLENDFSLKIESGPARNDFIAQ
jgi:hypothetical protein